MTWRRLQIDEHDRIAGNYVALIQPLKALRSALRREARLLNDEWSKVVISFLFADDRPRARLLVDDVRFVPQTLPPRLLEALFHLRDATPSGSEPWQSAKITVHRIGFMTADFFTHLRGYRPRDWVTLRPPRSGGGPLRLPSASVPRH
jgi:hypothetical protein